jgi:hypothetical protein
MSGGGELPSPFSVELLDEIWDSINSDKYIEIEKEITNKGMEIVVLYPVRVYSDDSGDMMSIPVNGGCKRDIYMRKKDGKWHKPE